MPEVAFAFQVLSEIPRSAPEINVQRLGFGSGTVAAIAGPPNSGKTALAVAIATCVAARDTFFGLATKGGPVAYFAPEAPSSVAMRAHARADCAHPGKPLPFYLIKDTPSLGAEALTERDTNRIIRTIQEISSTEGEPVLLAFIDTLASCLAGGEENGAGMVLLVNAAKRIANETGCCVVIVHHPSKADGKGLRGHGSLAAAVDSILEITSDEVTGIRTATLTKSRDTATGLQLHYTLQVVETSERDQWGDAVTTVIAIGADKPAGFGGVRATGVNQQRALTALREWARTHLDVGAVTSHEIRDLLAAHHISRQRRPEVLDFLARAKVLTPSLGGYSIDREMLS